MHLLDESQSKSARLPSQNAKSWPEPPQVWRRHGSRLTARRRCKCGVLFILVRPRGF
jgi:hypothetical protein